MAGIYLHIPFCKQACSYCDFHFSTTFEKYRSELIAAMTHEIEEEKGYLENQKVQTIYFGGGTPSLLTTDELQLLLKTVHGAFEVVSSPEITLEANPDDISENKLEAWKAAGITRLSIGLQSFIQSDLDWMNRAHTAEESYSAVQQAKLYGFDLTIDLIYGLPESNLETLAGNIDKAIDLKPEHISAYCLTIEPKTALKNWVDKGKISVPTSDEQADQFSFLVNQLKKAGYEQYEISNFATGNNYSHHNSNYWKGIRYLGIGPSAHSFNGSSRQWNVSNNRQYINKISANEQHYEIEHLTKEDQFNELVMTGLRTVWGVDLDRLSRIHKLPKEFLNTLSSFEKDGLINKEKNIIQLTLNGRLQADHIAAMLFI